MTIEQDFLPFAVGAGSNVLSQSAYAALSAISNGYSSGVAQSAAFNKTWRQSSIMAAVIAQFIVAETGQTAIDDGTTATLLANLTTAVQVAGRQNPVLADTGTANAYAAANLSAFSAYPSVSGLIVGVTIAHTNTGASTLNIDGLGTKPIYGMGGQALQGGEMPANSVAFLLYVVSSLYNSGNGAWILVECSSGPQQVAPATASQHAPQMAQVAGVVGSVRNLVMSVTAASASATMTADEIVVETALGGVRYCLYGFAGTINLATTGAGGMDTGSAPTSGFVAIYAIMNPTTGSWKLLATNATSAVLPNIYGGANMPAGYTASALVSVWQTNSSGLFGGGYQTDRLISCGSTNVLNTATIVGTLTAFSLAPAAPKNAKTISGTMQVTTGSATNCTLNVAGASGNIGLQSLAGTTTVSGQSIQANFARVPLVTPQTAYYSSSVAAGSLTSIVAVTSYEI